MATYRILYWQDIPAQVKVEDEDGEVNLPLPPRFMERIDELAAERNLQDAESYLEQWHWGEPQHRDGIADQVAKALVAELDSQADW